MLRNPYVDMNLARNGGYEKRAVYGSFTLETHNQNANWFSDGFLR